jgi:hypothetical protein
LYQAYNNWGMFTGDYEFLEHLDDHHGDGHGDEAHH